MRRVNYLEKIADVNIIVVIKITIIIYTRYSLRKDKHVITFELFNCDHFLTVKGINKEISLLFPTAFGGAVDILH